MRHNELAEFISTFLTPEERAGFITLDQNAQRALVADAIERRCSELKSTMGDVTDAHWSQASRSICLGQVHRLSSHISHARQ